MLHSAPSHSHPEPGQHQRTAVKFEEQGKGYQGDKAPEAPMPEGNGNAVHSPHSQAGRC